MYISEAILRGVGIIKDLEYKEVGTILYKDPTFGMFILRDDKGAQDIVDLCTIHLSDHMYEEDVKGTVGDVIELNVDEVNEGDLSEVIVEMNEVGIN